MFSKRLRDLRMQKNKTLSEVAKNIGVSISAYSNYEQGIRTPHYDILFYICKYFDVSADYLLGLID